MPAGDDTDATDVATPSVAHFGLFFRKGNAGDIVLRDAVARVLSPDRPPAQFNVRTPVDDEMLDAVNGCDLVVVGGGGLIWNNPRLDFESGWQWNVSDRMIRAVRPPMALYSVGDSTFDGESLPLDRIRRSFAAMVEKGCVFGFRNHGSFRSVATQLGRDIADRSFYQPCPTTFARHLGLASAANVERRDVVAVNIPMDRPEHRFGAGDFDRLIAKVVRLSQAFDVEFVCHVEPDDEVAEAVLRTGGVGRVVRLHGRPTSEIVDYYRSVAASVGGRAHSLLIPLGVDTPAVAVASHDKIRWISESCRGVIDAIDVRDAGDDDALVTMVGRTLDRRDALIRSGNELTEEFFDHSMRVRDALWEFADTGAAPPALRSMRRSPPRLASVRRRIGPTVESSVQGYRHRAMATSDQIKGMTRRLKSSASRLTTRPSTELRRLEDERRRIEDERRRIEDERRRIEDARRDLSEKEQDHPDRRELRRIKALGEEWKKAGKRNDRINAHLRHWLAETGHDSGRCLEIGAREHPRRDVFGSKEWEYLVLDIEDFDMNDDSVAVVVADITACPDIPDASYDVVVSVDVMEHIDRPWLAAEEITRILKPGGLSYTSTLFAWRYHPVPIDYWRYTPDCLEFLFCGLDTLECGFDTTERRRDIRGRGKRDKVAVDALGGFRENWRVHHVGRKPS